MQSEPTSHDEIGSTAVEGQRRRLMVFLILAGLYVSLHIIVRWCEYPLFRADDWYYFGPKSASLFEVFYRWFLTLLPIAAWGVVIFFVLTRVNWLTHRHIALVLILGGLMFLEADMAWFNMSKRHIGLTEIQVVFNIDAENGLGLRPSDYDDASLQFCIHALSLILCLFLSGPEIVWLGRAVYRGPFSVPYIGRPFRLVVDAVYNAFTWARPDRVFWPLATTTAKSVLVVLVLVDPIVIWALDQEEQDLEESRSVIRELAETNPLRMQSLDRAWHGVVSRFSDRAIDIEAANVALSQIDPEGSFAPGPNEQYVRLDRNQPPHAENVVFIQVESFNAKVFEDAKLPFLSEFSKKCLRLKRHSSTGNCTHYGVLGLLHGHPVTFYFGALANDYPCMYLRHFKEKGYRSRLLSMRIMDHHYSGQYINDWTEPVYEAGYDWACVPEFEKQMAKAGPHFNYLFYNFTHYPYRHEDKYAKFQPEVEFDFTYNRSDLILYREKIMNRYKNALLEMDDWVKALLSKVDLEKTIVVITGDHGEEILDHGRLGHCSSLNAAQTMTPCLVYVPGIAPRDVDFPTSHADMLPTVADALGWKTKPNCMGQSIFQPTSLRYAAVANFEYRKAVRWAIVSDDRKAIVERDSQNNLSVVSLVDWQGKALSFRAEPERWLNTFLIIRKLEAEMQRYGN